jgi:hypothetical protein
MANLGANSQCKCVFMNPPQTISHFSHSAQPKDIPTKVSNVHLDTRPMAWIKESSTSILHLCKSTSTLNAQLTIVRTSSICHHASTSTPYKKTLRSTTHCLPLSSHWCNENNYNYKPRQEISYLLGPILQKKLSCRIVSKSFLLSCLAPLKFPNFIQCHSFINHA